MNKTYQPTGYPLFAMHRDHANTVFAKIESEAIDELTKQAQKLDMGY